MSEVQKIPNLLRFKMIIFSNYFTNSLVVHPINFLARGIMR